MNEAELNAEVEKNVCFVRVGGKIIPAILTKGAIERAFKDKAFADTLVGLSEESIAQYDAQTKKEREVQAQKDAEAIANLLEILKKQKKVRP